MMDSNQVLQLKAVFDGIVHTTEDGTEFWYARELQTVLGYNRWEYFDLAVKKAVTSAENSGCTVTDHFRGAPKMVQIGSGATREVADYIMYVDWEYYKIFYYVAKYQNFTKAARVLGNNQPNITHSMNRLESQLNCVLFIRSNRGVTLTPEGEMLYSRIASAAVQIQDAEEELSASATLEHGTISISATETALNIYLSKKLRDFHTEYPGIRLRISNHSTPQAVQAVKNGEVDFAIVSTPAEIESGLKMVELKPFYEVLVGGRTFTALASQSLTLKELRSYPLISLSDESVTRSLYRQFFLDHGAVLKPDTEAATTDQMLTLVKSELGLAFVPEPMARDSLERGELVQLHLQEIIPTRSICLVYDRHRPLNTAARKFQQMLTKADPPRPAASKQTESISFVSQ